MLIHVAQVPFSAKLFSPPPKKPSTREREYLRSPEIKAMIRAAKKVGRHGIRDGGIILLMFRHGLRTAELVALKWTQIDLAGGYIEVHRVKNGRDSIHPLRSPEIRALRQIQSIKCQLLCPNDDNYFVRWDGEFIMRLCSRSNLREQSWVLLSNIYG